MWPYFKRLQGLRIVTKRKVKMYSIHPTEYDAYVLSRDRAIALCSETVWKKLWPDRKLNFSGHTEVKVLRNDNGLHFTKPSQKYMLIMSISILNDE